MYRTKLLLIALFTLCNIFTLTIQAQSDGKASYYSNGLHGRRMSNGERYDRNAFTCAHRTLPFGTRLKITNPRNGKSVIVRVTDRGPFVRGRVVDLSYAAARELGTLASGVAYVKVELVRKETEIPFPSESNGTLEIPEIEYGTAGVCYEFIPEWEKVEEDKPKEIERKVDTHLNNKKNLQQGKVEKENITETRKQVQTSAPANQQVTKTKNQATARTTPAATNRQQTAQQNKSTTQPTTSKNNSSSSWTNFFKRVKDGVTGLFE
ncbi:septal ring lytic transglycosylase RlpA family protein [Prevotella melaninogenica]|uniref:septal ring lytic transglycosylase RlpA family protein n=1 Tax=Prevotella melaninogenica TaxID=28132 RepID=UPI001C5D33B4|nr:septal ring lytic transglycosylase RlpA family protein [Prevotella melaninogenica]MBW4722971.1 septal ring lytic transglycosylase RlpA family protein [Prevotella melaninogenica]